MATRKSLEQTEEQLLESLRKSIEDAEALLKEAAGVGEDKALELRVRARDAIHKATESFRETQEKAIVQGKEAVRVTDEYVHDNPWRSMGMVGLAGLLLGVIIGRR
ncbi:MAG: DUF883 domain-containing protein [Alcaligenaceae bacterium]|nr:DUF883 domain-containing protein [Alcaligenaceae bacterium]